MRSSDKWLIIMNIWLAGAMLMLADRVAVFVILTAFHALLFFASMFEEERNV